jgi:bifunctional non-homologous end joining protein LigD
MIVALDDEGTPRFDGLVPRLLPAEGSGSSSNVHIAFHAFDILYRDSEPIMDFTLRRRKEILAQVVRTSDRILVPDHVQTDGIALFEAARQHELGGIVAKELNAPYVPGHRSRSWLAIRTFNRDNFVVGGFTFGGLWRGKKAARHRGPVESLLLGLYDSEGKLDYVGEASGSFGASDTVVHALDSATTTQCAFEEPPAVGKLVFWCRPQFVASVRYADWTPAGLIRFAVFENLRPDVPPETCLLDLTSSA